MDGVPSRSLQTLTAHRERQDAQRTALGDAWRDEGLVFASEVGGPIEATNMMRGSFRRVVTRASATRIRFHDLRHTAASLLLGACVNPKVVSEMLGHSTVSITLDIYAHVLLDMQQDAATTMRRLLFLLE